jgi:hypothetical protein
VSSISISSTSMSDMLAGNKNERGLHCDPNKAG